MHLKRGRRADGIASSHADEIADQARVAGVMADAPARSAFLYDEAKCIRCGLCAIRCPTSAITMERFQFEETAV